MDKKHLIIFIIGLVALILSIVGAQLFYAKTIKLEGELTTLHQSVRDLEAQEKRILSVRETAEASGSDVAVIDAYFVNDKGALDFVKYVENLAVSSGLVAKIDVIDAQANDVLAASGKEYLKIAMRTTGSLANIRIFLNLIESLPYNVKMNRVDVRKTGEGVRDWSMTVDFSVVKTLAPVQ